MGRARWLRDGEKSWRGASMRKSGADLDLDADDMEQIAKTAACAVAKGTLEELLERKAALLGPEQPCPSCQRLCTVDRMPRSVQFWGAEVQYA